MSKKKVQKVEKEIKLLKVDLGCGQNKEEGWYGVDYKKCPGVDKVHDLTKFPWPFKDESVDEVKSIHYIEHTLDLIKFVDEIYRILKPGGKAMFIAPYYSSMRAFQDPTHVRFISEASFLYFNKNWRNQNKLDHYDIKSNFNFSYGYQLFPEWAARSEDSRNFAIKHYWNVVSDIIVTLEKI